MRLPAPSAHFSQLVRYGNYVARRLRRARMLALAADVEKTTALVLVTGRAREDADKPIQDALADRDAFDDDIDQAAQTSRLELAARSTDAVKTAPYTLIYPDGIGYYTAAPLDEEVARYGELKRRLEEHLPAADQVRSKTIAAIDAGLNGFRGAVDALTSARTAESLASTRLTAATEGWEKQIEKSYGAIVGEVGRATAERFFPRVRGKKNDAHGADEAGEKPSA
jgi:hypothetical protein